jgi:thioredoxin 2
MTNTPRPDRPVVVMCVFCGTVNRVDLNRLSEGPKCGKCGRPMLLDRPLPVTDTVFEKLIKGSSVPVLVDFYADWCAPCKVMAPVLDEFARQRTGEVLVLKLDTEANPATPARFGIRGIPTLIVFEHGQEVKRQVGAVQAAELEKLVQSPASAKA